MHLCCGFSMWRQMAPQESAKFRTAFFGQFRTSLRMDSVTNYASIWTLFSPSVTGPDVRCALQRTKHFASTSVGGATRLAIAVEILQSVNNRTQSLREIIRMIIMTK